MSKSPIQIVLTDEAFEKAARALVPFACGAFEQHGSAERPFEAGKPNANCYNAVRGVIAALQSAADTPAPPPPQTHVLPELPKLPPYSHSAFPHGFHELWTEKQMKQYARDTAAFWRNDVVEKAAQIAERYGVDPWIARDIRALAATATEVEP